MSLQYDANQDRVCHCVQIDTEDILTSIKILIEKKKLLENYEDGLKLKITGILYIDFINEELVFSF